MRSRRCALVLCVIGALLWPARAAAQETDDAVWGAFLAWYKAAPATDGSPFTGYAAALRAGGIPAAEAERRMHILVRLVGGTYRLGRTLFRQGVQPAVDR